jgi:DNA-binding response OmpR family regulator
VPVVEPSVSSRVVVLADDLIWSTRLVGHVRAAGYEAAAVRTADAYRSALAAGGVAGAIVDLTSLAYDGLAAIAAARDARIAVLAVGQHDDHVLRRDALAVGADRVLAYRKLFDDGPATIARWLAASRATPASPTAAPDRMENSTR